MTEKEEKEGRMTQKREKKSKVEKEKGGGGGGEGGKELHRGDLTVRSHPSQDLSPESRRSNQIKQ